jgi:hypothetical protein
VKADAGDKRRRARIDSTRAGDGDESGQRAPSRRRFSEGPETNKQQLVVMVVVAFAFVPLSAPAAPWPSSVKRWPSLDATKRRALEKFEQVRAGRPFRKRVGQRCKRPKSRGFPVQDVGEEGRRCASLWFTSEYYSGTTLAAQRGSPGGGTWRRGKNKSGCRIGGRTCGTTPAL